MSVSRPRKRKVPPEATLEEIRARKKAGLPLSRYAVRNLGLFDRARRDFGGWREALVAAGVAPPVVRRKTRRKRAGVSAGAGPKVPARRAVKSRRARMENPLEAAIARAFATVLRPK
jgi:hypothetical protein